MEKTNTLRAGLILLFVFYFSIAGFSQFLTKERFFNVSLGYQHTSFISNNYVENKALGLIRNKFGFSLGTFHEYGPFLWELNYFETQFGTDIPGLTLPEDVNITNNGLEFSMSARLIPKKTPVTPLLGIGYQTCSLRTNSSEDDSSFEPFSANTSGVIWKTGVYAMYRNMRLLLAYKQSFPARVEADLSNVLRPEIQFQDKQRALSQLTATLFLKLNFNE